MRLPPLLVLLVPTVASAEAKPAPAIVTLTGEQPVGVFVAAGNVVPCDSSSNKSLYRGVIKPGETLTLDTDAACVCVQQTFAPFTTTGWSAPALICRPKKCKKCAPDPTKPIRVTVRSKE